MTTDKKYPIAGFAPGNYDCKCVTCDERFHGDKLAYQCEPCAEKEMLAIENSDTAEIEKLARTLVPENTIEAFANFSDSDVFIAGFLAAVEHFNLNKTNSNS